MGVTIVMLRPHHSEWEFFLTSHVRSQSLDSRVYMKHIYSDQAFIRIISMDANIATAPSDSPAIWLSALKVVFAPELIGLRDRSAFLCQVSLMSVMNFCAARLLRVPRLRGWKEDRHWKPKKALANIGQRLSFVIFVRVCVCLCEWVSRSLSIWLPLPFPALWPTQVWAKHLCVNHTHCSDSQSHGDVPL